MKGDGTEKQLIGKEVRKVKRRFVLWGVVMVLITSLFALSVLATDAEMYFAADKNGQNRVSSIQEGDEIFIVIYDPDQNLDCDIRDKFTGDVKIMDPKTGAYIVWDKRADFDAGNPTGDYFEETDADTGLFVSNRAFQVGTRESFAAASPHLFTHVVDLPDGNGATDDFQWGHWMYVNDAPNLNAYADEREWFDYGPAFHQKQDPPGIGAPAGPPSGWVETSGRDYIIGRFENMDTLVGMFQDPNDATDVAVAMMKIIDTEATISWDKEVYKDANGSATITVVDPDENLNCNEIECVPVFIIVNPGSWNPVDYVSPTDAGNSPTNFCMLLNTGGVNPAALTNGIAAEYQYRIRWYNIYNMGFNASNRYYIQYDINLFRTKDGNGVTPVLFYAWETGVDTGVFQLNLNSLLDDLEFRELNVRDVMVAYYLDPNDFDDFKLAPAYIEERQHSVTSFTDAERRDMDLYWIGRDPVYVQVIDANANVDPCCPEQVVVHLCDPHGEDDSEWVVLDETSSNSPVFFTFAGMQLWPVWDALGVGLSDSIGGYQLRLDNWKLEVFNEDEVMARYNDVYYGAPRSTPTNGANNVTGGLATLGDSNAYTSFPPYITRIRVANDVSFDLMSIADTQVYDGNDTRMYFLDRNGNRIAGYVNSDCVFVEVIDIDQDEDQYRRERIDGFWDGGQNFPFGPLPLNEFKCDGTYTQTHPVNALLGATNIFNNSPDIPDYEDEVWEGAAKIYVLNPRSGRWAAVDLMETGVATGDFVSVICIDLVSVYSECVPTLDILPGDTVVAFYQDPSNHSDSAMISIKVGIGGGGTPPTQQSSTMFVGADGVEVSSYTDADLVYVKVIDPSHAGAASLENAVEIDGTTYDLAPLDGAPNDTFITGGLSLGVAAGDTITATYADPTDPTDTSSDTITVIASELDVERFYAAPSPFADDCTFGFEGSGVATVMRVTIYDLSGHEVWSSEQANVSEIVWNGTNATGASLANGGYIYVITATDGTNSFDEKGLVFVKR